MRKTIGILLLCSWAPFILGMSFQNAYGNSPWYTVAGFMLLIFGTWGGILLLTSRKNK